MVDLITVDQIKRAPIEDRIQIIELILQSLKNDLKYEIKKANKARYSQFKIRQFNLGKEIHVDRDEMYSDRGL